MQSALLCMRAVGISSPSNFSENGPISLPPFILVRFSHRDRRKAARTRERRDGRVQTSLMQRHTLAHTELRREKAQARLRLSIHIRRRGFLKGRGGGKKKSEHRPNTGLRKRLGETRERSGDGGIGGSCFKELLSKPFSLSLLAKSTLPCILPGARAAAFIALYGLVYRRAGQR